MSGNSSQPGPRTTRVCNLLAFSIFLQSRISKDVHHISNFVRQDNTWGMLEEIPDEDITTAGDENDSNLFDRGQHQAKLTAHTEKDKPVPHRTFVEGKHRFKPVSLIRGNRSQSLSQQSHTLPHNRSILQIIDSASSVIIHSAHIALFAVFSQAAKISPSSECTFQDDQLNDREHVILCYLSPHSRRRQHMALWSCTVIVYVASVSVGAAVFKDELLLATHDSVLSQADRFDGKRLMQLYRARNILGIIGALCYMLMHRLVRGQSSKQVTPVNENNLPMNLNQSSI
eukprot:gene4012-6459_t